MTDAFALAMHESRIKRMIKESEYAYIFGFLIDHDREARARGARRYADEYLSALLALHRAQGRCASIGTMLDQLPPGLRDKAYDQQTTDWYVGDIDGPDGEGIRERAAIVYDDNADIVRDYLRQQREYARQGLDIANAEFRSLLEDIIRDIPAAAPTDRDLLDWIS